MRRTIYPPLVMLVRSVPRRKEAPPWKVVKRNPMSWPRITNVAAATPDNMRDYYCKQQSYT